MSFFDELAERYLIPETKGFQYIAGRLKAGANNLTIRRELEAKSSLSTLAAGKLVEDAVSAIKVAKLNRLSGVAVTFVSTIALICSGNLGIAPLPFLGIAQFIAGQKVYGLYKSTPKLPAPPDAS